jgi:serine/threonine protein kinase
MAPERLDGLPLDLPSDVYSFAILAWELYSGEIPFSDVLDAVIIRVVVDKQRRPTRPVSLVNDKLWSLVEKCWQPDPLERPTFSTIHGVIEPLTSPSMFKLSCMASPELNDDLSQDSFTICWGCGSDF